MSMITLSSRVTRTIRGLRCLFGAHDWKRAVRFLGNSGSQTCRRCGAKRDVTLRSRRDLAPKADA